MPCTITVVEGRSVARGVPKSVPGRTIPPLAVFEMAAQAVMDIGLGAEIVGVHRGVIEVAEAVLGLHCDIDGEGCAVLCTSCSIPSP